MSRLRNGVAVMVITGLGLLANGGNARAQDYPRMGELAHKLDNQVKDFHKEVRSHFRNTPLYRHLDEDVAKLEKVTQHVHLGAHKHVALAHLQKDVEALSDTIHHVEGVISTLAKSGELDLRTVKDFRFQLTRINGLLNQLEDAVYFEDEGDLRFEHEPAPVPFGPALPSFRPVPHVHPVPALPGRTSFQR